MQTIEEKKDLSVSIILLFWLIIFTLTRDN